MGVSQDEPVDKLKRNGFLYGILIISIAGGHFYDGKAKRTNPEYGYIHQARKKGLSYLTEMTVVPGMTLLRG